MKHSQSKNTMEILAFIGLALLVLLVAPTLGLDGMFRGESDGFNFRSGGKGSGKRVSKGRRYKRNI